MAKVVLNAEYSGHSESANRVITLKLEAGSTEVVQIPELTKMCDQEVMMTWGTQRVGKFTIHESKVDRNGFMYLVLKTLADSIEDHTVFDNIAKEETCSTFTFITKREKKPE